MTEAKEIDVRLLEGAVAPEERRSSRIRARFWLRIEGLEDRPRLRGGDLSVTGFFVNLNLAVGAPGDLLWMEIASSDRAKSLRTLARISRVIEQSDLSRKRRVIGAAFEYLPHNQVSPEIIDLIHHVTTHELRSFGTVRLDRTITARVEPEGARAFSAQVLSLGPDQAVLSAPTALLPGTEVQLDVPYGDQSLVSLRGQVVRSTPESPSPASAQFNLVIRLELEGQPSDPPAGGPVGIETLMRNLVVPSVIPKRADAPFDLSGQLSRLRISSVLTLLEIERMTGLLAVQSEGFSADIHVCEGRVHDIDSTLAVEPRTVLARVLSLGDGHFEFKCQPVERLDRLAMSTTGLLLDVLRAQDERNKQTA